MAGHGSVCLAPGIHQSQAGEIFYIDNGLPLSSEPTDFAGSTSSKVPLDQVPTLHSHEPATQKIYLDFNGHVVSGTGWNELNQGHTIHAPAFDLDGDASTFNDEELAVIEDVWARVSEDFAPFEIDVTTEAPSVRSLRSGLQAIRVLISSNVDAASNRTWMHAGNGIAYVGSWRSESDTPAWVFANRLGSNAQMIAASASHELGHTFGLHHDGVHQDFGDDEEYFSGHGDGATGWAPIMGIGYHRPITQWNQGEYAQSNNSQRDIEIIASEQNGISLRRDDHANDLVFATYLAGDQAGNVTQQGLISSRDDRDAFRMELEPGVIDLLVSPASRGANLDIAVSLYDSRGWLVNTFRSAELHARVQTSVRAGSYFIVIDGVGSGDPATDGYSDYGSLGRYTITGTIPSSPVSALTQIRSAAKRLID